MEIFVVEIGRATRRGGMEVLTRRFVRTDLGEYRLRETFKESYKGFDVRVEKVDDVMTIVAPPIQEIIEEPPRPSDSKVISRLKEVKVEHLNLSENRFNQFFKIASAARQEFRKADRELSEAIQLSFRTKPEVEMVGEVTIDYPRDRALVSSITLRYPVYIEKVQSIEEPEEQK